MISLLSSYSQAKRDAQVVILSFLNPIDKHFVDILSRKACVSSSSSSAKRSSSFLFGTRLSPVISKTLLDVNKGENRAEAIGKSSSKISEVTADNSSATSDSSYIGTLFGKFSKLNVPHHMNLFCCNCNQSLFQIFHNLSTTLLDL